MESTLSAESLIASLGKQLKAYLDEHEYQSPKMIGIHTGGVWVAERLHKTMGIDAPLGSLNISFYRDDFTRIGLHPEVKPSRLPFEVEGQNILLVDDVVQTGRTIRAALNEIFDYGRPKSITLVALVERPGRELPIRADVVAKSLDIDQDAWLDLRGPDPLELVIEQKEALA